MAANTISGTLENNSLLGTAAEDHLQGLEGNDTLNGSGGLDSALYQGNAAGYRVQRNALGQWTVTDLDPANGDEGVDVLEAIESIVFADGVYTLALASRPEGTEFQVNSYTAGDQHGSVVSGLKDGGFVIIWHSYNQEEEYGVYGQRFDALGQKSGAEFRLNTTTARSQQDPSVATLADGSFVATWQSTLQDGSGWGVYGQRFAADGSLLGSEFRVNSYTNSDQSEPVVRALPHGGFVVAWLSLYQDGSSWGVYSQRFDANGAAVGAETRVTLSHYDQTGVALTEIADGGFLVTWHSNGQDGSSWGIYGRRFASDGTSLTNEFLINSTTQQAQVWPATTGLQDGGFVIVWQSENQDGSGWGIYGQRFNADGSRLDQEFRVNSSTLNQQEGASVSSLPDGGFVVVWMSLNQDGSSWGCYGQHFGRDGAKVGP